MCFIPHLFIFLRYFFAGMAAPLLEVTSLKLVSLAEVMLSVSASLAKLKGIGVLLLRIFLYFWLIFFAAIRAFLLVSDSCMSATKSTFLCFLIFLYFSLILLAAMSAHFLELRSLIFLLSLSLKAAILTAEVLFSV